MDARRENLLVDAGKCTGCGCCLMACAMQHHGWINPRLARIRLLRFPSGALNVPVICMACDQAPCIKVCPMNARIRQANGSVVTDEDACVGCRACVYICPAGSPTINPYNGCSMTCDMCREEPAGPVCVRACRPEGALTIVAAGSLQGPAARESAGRIRSIYPSAS